MNDYIKKQIAGFDHSSPDCIVYPSKDSEACLIVKRRVLGDMWPGATLPFAMHLAAEIIVFMGSGAYWSERDTISPFANKDAAIKYWTTVQGYT